MQEYEHEHSWVLENDTNEVVCSTCGWDGKEGPVSGIDEELMLMEAQDVNGEG